MRNILFLLLASLVFVSCGRVLGKRINGNGSITTANRPASGFNAVAASSNVDVYVKTDSTYGVRVVTDANIQEYIYTDISGSTLKVGIKKGYRPKPTDGIKVYVAGPSINKFEASGACKIFTENQVTNSQEITIRLSGACDATMDLNSPDVKAELSGAGTLNLKGQAKTLSLRGTGSSTLKCADMMAENVKVNITGAGEADVFASVNLDVKVTGAGTVRYKGNPSVNQRVSGAGTVKKLN